LIAARTENYAKHKQLCAPPSVQLLASGFLYLTYTQILFCLIQYGFRPYKEKRWPS